MEHILITEMKDFIKSKKGYPSYTFVFQVKEYKEIANILPKLYYDFRVQVKTKEQMPFEYRTSDYKGKYVILTISK